MEDVDVTGVGADGDVRVPDVGTVAGVETVPVAVLSPPPRRCRSPEPSSFTSSSSVTVTDTPLKELQKQKKIHFCNFFKQRVFFFVRERQISPFLL